MMTYFLNLLKKINDFELHTLSLMTVKLLSTKCTHKLPTKPLHSRLQAKNLLSIIGRKRYQMSKSKSQVGRLCQCFHRAIRNGTLQIAPVKDLI